MTLIKVLLPAPLGPMTARISPEFTDRSTSDSALTPPKERLMPSSANTSLTARAPAWLLPR